MSGPPPLASIIHSDPNTSLKIKIRKGEGEEGTGDLELLSDRNPKRPRTKFMLQVSKPKRMHQDAK